MDTNLGGILISHLPEGPTAYFKVSNLKVTKDLRVSLA